MIKIQELLYNRGLTSIDRIKLVRHKSPTYDLYNMYRSDKPSFLHYQSSQHRDVFNNVSHIVSFIGEDGLTSRFVGVFKILSKEVLDNGNLFYQMEEIEGFEDMKERVIIRWKNAISWHQWISNEMEIIEIKPGLHYKQFTDYFDFILTFKELKEIVENEYSDWKRMLSVTKGIYLIHDIKTGSLYVGSAYGEKGIWGRWSNYIKSNGHGGNKSLIELCNIDALHPHNFQFSILMLLPSTITADEAIKKEKLFKNKLGTNAFGLNNN